MNFVRGETGGGAARNILVELDATKTSVAIIISVVCHYEEHLGHCMVDTLNDAISRRLVGACGEFMDAK